MKFMLCIIKDTQLSLKQLFSSIIISEKKNNNYKVITNLKSCYYDKQLMLIEKFSLLILICFNYE